jgi:undecaprenyl-diphosphatase
MGVADRRARPPSESAGDPLERIAWAQGLAVGLAQTLALVPGTSRSGITLTFGLFVGLDRATAARFSFLLGLVVTGLAGAWETLKLARAGAGVVDPGPLAAAVVAAFASGWLAVWFLVNYLRKGSLVPFVIYRLLLAAAILLVVLG